MSFNSMADNYRNNQSVNDCKSNYKTYINKSNTRKPWRIFCYNCNLYTESIEPIIIRRSNSHSFAFLTACNNCENLKTLVYQIIIVKNFYVIILIYQCINHI